MRPIIYHSFVLLSFVFFSSCSKSNVSYGLKGIQLGMNIKQLDSLYPSQFKGYNFGWMGAAQADISDWHISIVTVPSPADFKIIQISGNSYADDDQATWDKTQNEMNKLYGPPQRLSIIKPDTSQMEILSWGDVEINTEKSYERVVDPVINKSNGNFIAMMHLKFKKKNLQFSSVSSVLIMDSEQETEYEEKMKQHTKN